MKRRVTRSEIVKSVKDKEKKENFTIRMSPSLYHEFEMACKKEGVSRAAVIEELIRRFVDQA